MTGEDTDPMIIKEPILKYRKFKGDLEMICVSSSLSCAAFHRNHYAIGTTEGLVILLNNNDKIIRQFNNHTSRITSIAFDKSGDYIITGSQDGMVFLSTTLDMDKTSRDYKSQITGLYLDDDISVSHSRGYIVSTLSGNLIYCRKGLMGSQDIHLNGNNRQPIYSLCRKDSLLAYAYEGGVVVYDMNKRKRITEVQRYAECPDIQYVHPQLFWKDSKTLLIGWGEVIKVLRLEYTISNNDINTLTYSAMVTATCKYDFWINGLGYLDEDNFYLFSYPLYNPDEISQIDDEPVQSLIISYDSQTVVEGNVLDSDSFKNNKATDYYVTSLSYSENYLSEQNKPYSVFTSYTYILSPKCLLRVSKRNIYDHIQWLEDHHQYEDALACSMDPRNHLTQARCEAIENDHLTYLFSTQQYDETAKLLSTYLKQNISLWEQWISRFLSLNVLDYMATYIPVENPRLQQYTYTLILCYFITYNPAIFILLLKRWPQAISSNPSQNLYDIDFIIDTLEKTNIENDSNLIEGKAELYIMKNRFEDAVALFLDSGIQTQKLDSFFHIIQAHNLYTTISSRVKCMMLLDSQMSADMFTKHTSELPPDSVYDQLKDSPDLLVVYLNSLLVNSTSLYNREHYKYLQQIHLELIVDYCPETLITFLHDAAYCDYERAQSLCSHHNPPLHKDLVFLLTRLGNTSDALKKCVYDIGDAEYCMNYVQSNVQYDLWEELVNIAYDKPDFVSALLDNMTDHIDPLILLNKIPSDMHIDGLKDKLKKILDIYSLEIELRESCKDILLYDVTSLIKQFITLREHGVAINPQDICPICEQKLLQTQIEDRKVCYKDITVFPCNHIYHHDCITNHPSLLSYDEDSDDYVYKCYVCNPSLENNE